MPHAQLNPRAICALTGIGILPILRARHAASLEGAAGHPGFRTFLISTSLCVRYRRTFIAHSVALSPTLTEGIWSPLNLVTWRCNFSAAHLHLGRCCLPNRAVRHHRKHEGKQVCPSSLYCANSDSVDSALCDFDREIEILPCAARLPHGKSLGRQTRSQVLPTLQGPCDRPSDA